MKKVEGEGGQSHDRFLGFAKLNGAHFMLDVSIDCHTKQRAEAIPVA